MLHCILAGYFVYINPILDRLFLHPILSL